MENQKLFLLNHYYKIKTESNKSLLAKEYTIINDVQGIPGLIYIPNFITKEEEREIVKMLNKRTWHYMKKFGKNIRKVQHYGYLYNYHGGKPKKADPIPSKYRNLIKKANKLNVIKEKFNQVIVNEYEPGHGIGPHTDHEKQFDKEVMSLSMVGETVMQFVHLESGKKERVKLPRRSLAVLTGDSRYKWTHEIRKQDVTKKRISLTMRKVADQYVHGGMDNDVKGLDWEDDDKEDEFKDWNEEDVLLPRYDFVIEKEYKQPVIITVKIRDLINTPQRDIKSGRYDYIIKKGEDDEIHLIKTNEYKYLVGHWSFFDKETYKDSKVLYAGELQYDKGIVSWNNKSGHYMPSVNNYNKTKLPLNKFERNWFDPGL
jgi:alkylated DNA repair dioxygenase AlkB